MKTRRILALLLAFVLCFTLAFVFTSCGEDEPEAKECTSHTDSNGDSKCDNCNKDIPTEDEPTEDEPTEDEPTEDEPTEDEPTEDDPTEDDPTEDQPTEDKPTEDEPTEDEPTEDEPTEDEPTEDEPTEDEPTEDQPTEDDPDKDPIPDGAVVLVDNKEVKFKIVVADGFSTDVLIVVNKFVTDLAAIGVETEIVADTADTATDCEIIIGVPNSRGDAYKVDQYSYGYKGYSIKVVDGKIQIVGGSEDSLEDAIGIFKKDILGIKKSTKEIVDCYVIPSQGVEVIQNDYSIESVSFGGNDLSEFVIVASEAKEVEIAVAKTFRDQIYKKIGIWLPIVEPNTEYGTAIIFNLTDARTCKSDKGFALKVDGGNVYIDCGFANKFEEATLGFLMPEIINSKKTNITFNNGYTYEKVDYKNIYYSDYGAKGDGEYDDFYALKECHDYANEWGHTVNADSNATYYLGKGSGYDSIVIRTDTNWNGCKFIFDDHEIKSPHDYDGSSVTADPEYYTSIFLIDNPGEAYGFEELPITTLYEGATNIGFAPGYRAMIFPYNSNIRHFIRYGANQNSGSSQSEIIMVEADGTIDPTTPVQWNYDVVTSLYVYQMDAEPITISGGEGDVQTHIETIFNGAPSFYDYYQRNIMIKRPNVTMTNIKHTITGEVKESDGGTGAPYTGFITIQKTENVLIEGCEFQCPAGYSTIGSAGTSVGMGTYEINASSSNNITWKDCTQSNFFLEDGSIKFNGMMGTNYCKNLNFDNVMMCSFDAHCGTYNATLKNSTCEHINFIGEGTIILENVTIHANASKAGLIFRDDYGSTWEGDVIVKGLNLKYYNATWLEFGRTKWVNHFFGYTTYLPENIWLDDVKITRIGYSVDADGNRKEWDITTNDMPLYLYYYLESYSNYDISDPNEDFSKDPTTDQINCKCKNGFNDGNSDGLCDVCKFPEVADYSINRNPFVPTKNVYITNSPGLKLKVPNTPQFEDLNVYVDGEEYNWRDTGGLITVPTE